MSPRFLPFLAVAALVGCTVGPDHHAPDLALPETWGSDSARADDATSPSASWAQWWQQFDDPALDRLVAQALDDNLEIALQTARVEEFRARLGLARADRWPTLDAQTGASRERTPAAANPLPGATASTQNLFTGVLSLGYEIDLWGRLAREREAADALLAENVYAREAIRLQVAADVVATYFDLRAADRQVTITAETIASREASLRLQEIRQQAGDIDRLSLQQARSELESARAELPLRTQRRALLEGALGILVGLEPAALWDTLDWQSEAVEIATLPQPAPDFLPSELLARRPDIRAADAALQAATARIGVAEAQRLPRLNLSALGGTAALAAGDVFTTSANTWSLAASAAGPLWDFGRSRSRTETAEAQAAQAEVRYRLTVTSAFNEVRNALILYRSSGERTTATARLVEALEENRRLAQARYDEGYSAYLTLLDAERALLSARLAHEEAQRDRYTAAATLFKALGGDWEANVTTAQVL